jgi:RNA polymerase sigma factor (sigma-70 family)
VNGTPVFDLENRYRYGRGVTCFSMCSVCYGQSSGGFVDSTCNLKDSPPMMMASRSSASHAKTASEHGPVKHGISASIAPEKLKSRDIKDYMELVETVARVEHSRLPNHLMDVSEIVSIGALTIHLMFERNPDRDYNVTYLSTAMKWAIRNELRYRYKWYSFRNAEQEGDALDEFGDTDDFGPERSQVREAVYNSVLSVDGMMEAETPNELRDERQTPDEESQSKELARMVRECMERLPERDRKLLEARFFRHQRMREIGLEFGISPSRASRVVQSALNRIKEEIEATGMAIEF